MPKYLDSSGLTRFWENIKNRTNERDPLLMAHIMMRNVNTEDWRPKLCVSRNAIDWTPVPNAFDTNVAYGEMSRPFFKDDVAYFVCRTAGVNNKIGYYVTEDFINAEFKTVDLETPSVGVSTNWTPQIVEDSSGNTYIISTVFTGNTFNTFEINEELGNLVYTDIANAPKDNESVCYIAQVNIENGTIAKIENAKRIDITFNGNENYCGIDYDILYWNDEYHILYRDTRFHTIAHGTSDSIYGPYVISDYTQLAITRDVNQEAPVMTVVNGVVLLNYQTYGRNYGTNLLASTADFNEWTFIGYPRRIDRNQFTFASPTTHGERPRNIAPQIVPAKMRNKALRDVLLIETGGFEGSNFGITVQPESSMPMYAAFYELSNGERMSPCMPHSLFTLNHTAGYNEHFVRQNSSAMCVTFRYGRFYPFSEINLRVINANKVMFWSLNGTEHYFGGAGSQKLKVFNHDSTPLICGTTISFSCELSPEIDDCPVRAFLNVPQNGSHIEIKVIRKSSSYTGQNIAVNTNLFKLPFSITANKVIPHITQEASGIMFFNVNTNGYIRNSVEITQALATGVWECSEIITQWNVNPSSIS